MNRTRDELWESLVEACGATPEEMTKSERGRYNRALKELREVGATPSEIGKRARQYHSTYPGAALTPSALVVHWSALKPPPPRYLPPGRPVIEPGGVDDLEIVEPEVSPEERQRNLRRLRDMIEGVGVIDDAEA